MWYSLGDWRIKKINKLGWGLANKTRMMIHTYFSGSMPVESTASAETFKVYSFSKVLAFENGVAHAAHVMLHHAHYLLVLGTDHKLL